MKLFFLQRIRRTTTIAALGLCLCATAVAEPAKPESIRQLMETTGATAMSAQMMQQMLPALKRSIPDAPDAFWQEVMQELNPNDMIDLIIPVYQQHLSESDIQAINAFNQTPAGKRLLQAQPLIMQDSMKIGQQWGADAFRKVLSKYQQQTQEATAAEAAN